MPLLYSCVDGNIYLFVCLFCGAAAQRGSWPPHFWMFLDHTQQRITVGRTPLEEWSARRRDLYLTTHNTQYRQTSMSPVVFEPTISASERRQTYALDRAATGTGTEIYINKVNISNKTVSIFRLNCYRNGVVWISVSFIDLLRPTNERL